jgi:hypothetical protein
MPYISWSVVPLIIGTIKKYKPAWKEKVGDFWPMIAVVICILLNTIGVSIKPTDLDLPPQAPPGIHLDAPKRIVRSMPAPAPPVVVAPAAPGDTGGTIAMLQAEPEDVKQLPEVLPQSQQSSNFPLWLKVLLFSIMGGLGASKLYDEWKRRKANREACRASKLAVTRLEEKK